MPTPDAWHAQSAKDDQWRPGSVGLCGKVRTSRDAPARFICQLPANHLSSHLYKIVWLRPSTKTVKDE